MWSQKGAIKACVVWCHHKKKPWQKKNQVRQERGEEEEGWGAPHDKSLANMEDGGDGATPLLSANLPHSSIYKHQLLKKVAAS